MRKFRDWRGSRGGKNGCNFCDITLAKGKKDIVRSIHFESPPGSTKQIIDTKPIPRTGFVSSDSVERLW